MEDIWVEKDALGPRAALRAFTFCRRSFNAWLGKIRHKGAAEFDVGQYDEQKEVDFVEASCVLAKRAVIKKIGLLDATYFAYLEDVDWCLRGQRAGYATVFVPQATIWHKEANLAPTKTGCTTPLGTCSG